MMRSVMVLNPGNRRPTVRDVMDQQYEALRYERNRPDFVAMTQEQYASLVYDIGMGPEFSGPRRDVVAGMEILITNTGRARVDDAWPRTYREAVSAEWLPSAAVDINGRILAGLRPIASYETPRPAPKTSHTEW